MRVMFTGHSSYVLMSWVTVFIQDIYQEELVRLVDSVQRVKCTDHWLCSVFVFCLSGFMRVMFTGHCELVIVSVIA